MPMKIFKSYSDIQDFMKFKKDEWLFCKYDGCFDDKDGLNFMFKTSDSCTIYLIFENNSENYKLTEFLSSFEDDCVVINLNECRLEDNEYNEHCLYTDNPEEIFKKFFNVSKKRWCKAT